MLLDENDENVLKMLENPSHLKNYVEKAVQTLDKHNFTSESHSAFCNVRKSAAESSPELCDALYAKISVLEPSMPSELTGMLAELDSDTVSQLLASPEMLRQAMSRAKDSYLKCYHVSQESSVPHTEKNNNHTAEADLGTGRMLLEMRTSQLQHLLSDDPDRLNLYIHWAYQTLQQYHAQS
ncbi:uncharacterized protein LOC124267889 [Haliotis rubra]|uniref:uncharacterized protein LOC124267889 n=1 Tax=Haliotis rubra TaxID=36100 RepID=UPI001EE54373|nr:uncharacterized protein LOC124267889 [Haliotis rubra]